MNNGTNVLQSMNVKKSIKQSVEIMDQNSLVILDHLGIRNCDVDIIEVISISSNLLLFLVFN